MKLMYSKSNKKRNTPIYFNINYRSEMKLLPIEEDYCLLSFDALIFFLAIFFVRDLYQTLIFFQIKTPNVTTKP